MPWFVEKPCFALRRGEHPAYILHAGYDVGGAACSVDGCQRVALDGTKFAHQWALDLEAEELPFMAAYDVRDAFLLVRSGGVLPPKSAHLFAEVREDLFLDFRLRGHQPAGQLPGLSHAAGCACINQGVKVCAQLFVVIGGRKRVFVVHAFLQSVHTFLVRAFYFSRGISGLRGSKAFPGRVPGRRSSKRLLQ